jgi:hypothetical protein
MKSASMPSSALCNMYTLARRANAGHRDERSQGKAWSSGPDGCREGVENGLADISVPILILQVLNVSPWTFEKLCGLCVCDIRLD